MIHLLYYLKEEMQDMRMRGYENEHRLRHLEHRVEPVFDFVQLMFEATEGYHQDCLDLIHLDGIGKYTLAEVESCRFMTPYQFNNLRASKRGNV